MESKMQIEEILTELLMIKLQIRRSRSLDKKQEYMREFANILYDNYERIALQIELITDKDKNYFNIMPPVGGGYYIRPEASIHCYKCGFGNIQVVFDSFVGFLNLIKDPCGIDNLRLLANWFYSEKDNNYKKYLIEKDKT